MEEQVGNHGTSLQSFDIVEKIIKNAVNNLYWDWGLGGHADVEKLMNGRFMAV